jgi:signal peptidase I
VTRQARGAALGVLATLAVWAGVRPWVVPQFTSSMPVGLYRFEPGASATLRRGDVAVACIPAAFGEWAVSMNVLPRDRRCGGVEPVLKRVVAVAGDRVRIERRGVTVNGVLLAGTARNDFVELPCPDTGKVCLRRVPHVPDVDRTLRPGEVVLLGDNRTDSFDARYFGVVSGGVLGAAAMMVPL